ncbi:hypothetical protein GCM10011289_18650 [Paludibacterium paludis]|uniref:Glycoside hydrolase family 5 domain-containing protein n=2 Tax=Paludibacterium paludis TaxID=1225769 RepID=A0A918P2W2_9NEIS|nr:hypothetical protein GCM10011289_18650 [Paludibacterium paludis]
MAVTPPLAFSNRFLTAADFDNEQLRGFVIGGTTNVRNAAYFDGLKRNGANLARVFFPFKRCQSCSQYGISDDDLKALNAMIVQAKRVGIYLVIVGAFQYIETGDVWKNKALQASMATTWAKFAKIYANEKIIAGYDIVNEPNPPWDGSHPQQAIDKWNPIASNIIDMIRLVDRNHVIIYETIAGGSTLGFQGLKPLPYDNIVYSIHYYSPHDITHQKTSATYSRTIPYPTPISYGIGTYSRWGVTAFDKDRLALDFQDVIAFKNTYKKPVYVGEFSCVRWAPGSSAYNYISDVISLFKQYKLSWTYHEFRGYPGWDAEIASQDPAYMIRTDNAPVITLIRQAIGAPTAPIPGTGYSAPSSSK